MIVLGEKCRCLEAKIPVVVSKVTDFLVTTDVDWIPPNMCRKAFL